MPIPSGAHYVSGTGRRQVRLANGSIVKRQAAENAYARNVGANSDYELRKAKASSQGRTAIRSKLYGKHAEDARRTGRFTGKEFRDLAMVTAYEYSGATEADKGPESTLARYLYATGRRSSILDYSVGDTPSTAA